jgi:hypothetical protein
MFYASAPIHFLSAVQYIPTFRYRKEVFREGGQKLRKEEPREHTLEHVVMARPLSKN